MNVQIEEGWKRHWRRSLKKIILSGWPILSVRSISRLRYILPEDWFSMHSTFVLLIRWKWWLSGRTVSRTGQAHGLCFSVNDGVAFPPSLQNIFKEIHDDLGMPIPASGNLTTLGWAGCAAAERYLDGACPSGWFTSAQRLGRVYGCGHPCAGWTERTFGVYLVGAYAQKKGAFIDRNKHLVLTSVHPSPLSAYNGFFGNKHFSRTNEYLVAHGRLLSTGKKQQINKYTKEIPCSVNAGWSKGIVILYDDSCVCQISCIPSRAHSHACLPPDAGLDFSDMCLLQIKHTQTWLSDTSSNGQRECVV